MSQPSVVSVNPRARGNIACIVQNQVNVRLIARGREGSTQGISRKQQIRRGPIRAGGFAMLPAALFALLPICPSLWGEGNVELALHEPADLRPN